MRSTGPTGLLPLLLGLTASSALAQTGLFELLDLHRIDRSELAGEFIETDPPLVHDSEILFEPDLAPTPPDASLDRAVSQIALDPEGFRAIPVVQASAVLEVDLPTVTLEVAGRRRAMAVAEIKRDHDFDATHFTLLATASSDYARFTVSDSGPEVVGTIFLGDDEYRILPGVDRYQIVYPVVAHRGAWRRERPADLDARAGWLEARHLQVGWVADRQPARFRTANDGRPNTYAEGPSLGKLNFWSALSFDAAGSGSLDAGLLAIEAETFLNRLSHFTWVGEAVYVRIDEIDAYDLTTIGNEGLTISGVQLINGVPTTEALSLQVSPSTDVLQFRGNLARRDMAPPYDGERILIDEARLTSAIALRDTYGLEATEDIGSEALIYRFINASQPAATGDGSLAVGPPGDRLELVWRIERQAECGLEFLITIDAISGVALDTRITDNAGVEARTTEDLILRCRYFRALNPAR